MVYDYIDTEDGYVNAIPEGDFDHQHRLYEDCTCGPRVESIGKTNGLQEWLIIHNPTNSKPKEK